MRSDLYSRFYEVEDRYWWSIGVRATAEGFLRLGRVEAYPRVLEVGCGTGPFLRHLEPLGRLVVGFDLAAEALHFCRLRGFHCLCRGDVNALPFPGQTFDLVVALDLLEHLEDDVMVLQELKRVLKPGGRLLLNVPAFRLLWGDHDEVNGHYRRYRRPELLTKVTQAGFEVIQSSYLNCLLFPPVALVRVLRRQYRKLSGDRRYRPDIVLFPGWLNRLLTRLLLAEKPWALRGRLPVGTSLMCLAERRGG